MALHAYRWWISPDKAPACLKVGHSCCLIFPGMDPPGARGFSVCGLNVLSGSSSFFQQSKTCVWVEVNWLLLLGLSVNGWLSLMLWWACDLPRVYLSSCIKAVGISSSLPMTPLGNKAVESGWRFQLALAINAWLCCCGFCSPQPILAPFWICFVCHACPGSDRARLCALVALSHCLACRLLLAQDTGSPQPLASLNTACFWLC